MNKSCEHKLIAVNKEIKGHTHICEKCGKTFKEANQIIHFGNIKGLRCG